MEHYGNGEIREEEQITFDKFDKIFKGLMKTRVAGLDDMIVL